MRWAVEIFCQEADEVSDRQHSQFFCGELPSFVHMPPEASRNI